MGRACLETTTQRTRGHDCEWYSPGNNLILIEKSHWINFKTTLTKAEEQERERERALKILNRTVTISPGQHGPDLTLFYLYTHCRALLHAPRFSPFFSSPSPLLLPPTGGSRARAARSCYTAASTSITRYVFASSCSRCRSNLVYGRPGQRFKTQKSKTKHKKEVGGGGGGRRIPPSPPKKRISAARSRDERKTHHGGGFTCGPAGRRERG